MLVQVKALFRAENPALGEPRVRPVWLNFQIKPLRISLVIGLTQRLKSLNFQHFKRHMGQYPSRARLVPPPNRVNSGGTGGNAQRFRETQCRSKTAEIQGFRGYPDTG